MTIENDRYKKMFPISWEQLHRDCRALSWRLLELGPFQGIYCITRGGLVPAAILARELNLHLIDTVCISSYAWQNQDKATILKPVQGDLHWFAKCYPGRILLLSMLNQRDAPWLILLLLKSAKIHGFFFLGMPGIVL